MPNGTALVVDAGSGFLPCGTEILKEGTERIELLFTHYHHDHTQGLLLSPTTFVDGVMTECYGPKEMSVGSKEMLEALMRRPLFPIQYGQVAHRFRHESFDVPQVKVILIHPTGGKKVESLENVKAAEAGNGQLSFGKAGKFPISECLVIKMNWSNHPERTICYRFEERPTGKVFVFLTDCENYAEPPRDVLAHIGGADLLVMDCQYDEETYRMRTSGFGHGTPKFCASMACRTKAKVLGLSHHDPQASDDSISILCDAAIREVIDIGVSFAEAGDKEVPSPKVVVCRDYDVREV